MKLEHAHKEEDFLLVCIKAVRGVSFLGIHT